LSPGLGSLVIVVALLVALARSGAWGAEIPDFGSEADEEITVDAETIQYDRANDVISASGGVVIRRGDSELRAERVRLDRKTSEAEAVGDASFTNPEGVIRASEIRINLEEETGTLLDAEIHSPVRGYSLWGDRIEKGIGQHYHIENGNFTTCQCAEGPPSWSVSGDRLHVDLEGYGDLRGGRFKVMDIPLLPIPRAKFPVQRDRQSGLLLPRVGVSNRRGFQLLQPFYWAIDRSQDATIGVDIETSARLGLVGEYRYAFRRDLQGAINVSYFNEAIRGAADQASTSRFEDPGVPQDRWGLLANHTQRVGSAEAYADLMVVGDDLFFREINTYTVDNTRDVALRTLPFTTSRAGFLQGWRSALVQGEAIVYQDLIGRPSLALQRVPEVSLFGQRKLAASLFGQMNASITNFQRERGITGLRGDVRPSLQLALPLGRFVSGSLQASVGGTGYQLTNDSMRCGLSGTACPPANGTMPGDATDDLDEPVDLPATSGRGIFQLRGDLSSGIARVIEFPFLGIDKLKHTIEPRIRYLYVPNVDQDDLPVFDTLDRINQRNLIAYGVASRLLARSGSGQDREAGDVYELVRVSVLQGYDFSREIAGVGLDAPADHFSDIDFSIRVNPSRRTAVHFRSSYDTGDGDLSFASGGVRLRDLFSEADAKGTARLLNRTAFNAEYRFVRDNGITPGTNNEVQQLYANTVLRLTRRFGFLYATRYDVRATRFLENHYGIRFLSACDCWGLDVGITDKANPDEIELRAQLTLVGLGSAGTGTPFD
jgi:LPS-assembly protein